MDKCLFTYVFWHTRGVLAFNDILKIDAHALALRCSHSHYVDCLQLVCHYREKDFSTNLAIERYLSIVRSSIP